MYMNKKVNTLSIESVGAEHAGTYVCIAKNKAGESSYATVLNVNGKLCPRTLFDISIFFLLL